MQLSTAQEARKQTAKYCGHYIRYSNLHHYVLFSSTTNTYSSYVFHWTEDITNQKFLTYSLVVFTNGIFVQRPWIFVFRGNRRIISDQQEHSNTNNAIQKTSCNAENQLWDELTSTHISHQMITIVTGVTDLGVRTIAAVVHCAVYCKTTMSGWYAFIQY